jgi:(+)-pinoresinol hydroxylase
MRRRGATAVIAGLLLALGAGVMSVPGAALSAAQQPAAQPAAPPAALAPPLARGKAVFDEWCAGCHSRGPRQPGTQALQALYKGGKPAALEDRTDLVPALTETFVRKGVSVMPPFRKTEITDAQLADLAAYLAPKPR